MTERSGSGPVPDVTRPVDTEARSLREVSGRHSQSGLRNLLLGVKIPEGTLSLCVSMFLLTDEAHKLKTGVMFMV